MTDVENIQGDDFEIDGQMSIYDLFESDAPKPIVAVSKVFAAAIKQMNLKEWKTFVYALTHIKWKDQNKRIVHLPKWDLVDVLGIKSDSTDVSEHLKRDIGKLPKHSFLEFQSKDSDFWESGTFITRIRCYRDYVLLAFNDYYLPLFEELDKEKNYITMWAADLFNMTSERSILFYESLRLHSDTRVTNTRIYAVRDFKQMFSIPMDGKGSYMRQDGYFDRPAFERYVIDPLCEDLQKCAMIKLHVNENGKPYRKVKNHGHVSGYEFSWDVSNRPAIATAEEKKAIKQDIDANPEILKVAKDITTGKIKKKTGEKRDERIHNFEERAYDFKELEKKLIKN